MILKQIIYRSSVLNLSPHSGFLLKQNLSYLFLLRILFMSDQFPE